MNIFIKNLLNKFSGFLSAPKIVGLYRFYIEQLYIPAEIQSFIYTKI
nr:MAG TPA: hypothetical protein [Caudoviricetes sp.]